MSFTRLRYHIVTATRGRRCFIDDRIEGVVHDEIAEAIDEAGGRVVAVGGIEDHVHVVAAIRPDVAVADVVSRFKAHTSRLVPREFPSHSNFGWQSGYGAFTLWPDDMDDVVEYVRNQKRHHRRETLRERLERIDVG
ncbi:MAG: IS200/IS605 family transposase [Bradymonadaceae bacterium]